jgi:hypothetical protein
MPNPLLQKSIAPSLHSYTIMSNQDDQSFADEPVTQCHASCKNEQIPVVEDSKYGSEGMVAMDHGLTVSDT